MKEWKKWSDLERFHARENAKLHLREAGMSDFPNFRIRHPNSARFHELLREVGDLHDRKQADYGRGDDPFANVRASSDWGMPAWVGAMIRATDKVRRLQTFARKGELANEAVEDAFMDLACYALIARVLYEDENNQRTEGFA